MVRLVGMSEDERAEKAMREHDRKSFAILVAILLGLACWTVLAIVVFIFVR